MNYHQFFYDSLSIILQAFQDFTEKNYLTTLKNKYQKIVTPMKSIYVQIFALSDDSRTKIQQWKFKPKNQTTIQGHLQRSYSQQNSNDNDSQLSFSQLNEPTFFKTLQNIRKSIQPKILFKRLEKPTVVCQIKDNQKELVSFQNGNTFYFQVSEYQNELFQVKLSFKYNYSQDQVVARQINELKIIKQSDSDDFQLLIDQSYERQRQRQFKQQLTSKVRRQNSLHEGNSPKKEYQQKQGKFKEYKTFTSGIEKVAQSTKHLKSKRQLEFQQIQKLFNNIDFSNVQSSRLKSFLEYLL